ncbi:MAG: hypothetical protein HY815_32185 [Candidatus Riflebacteria bacterium]|nr:hypothetical protein [Candidatus Riflebacteria bacterium]
MPEAGLRSPGLQPGGRRSVMKKQNETGTSVGVCSDHREAMIVFESGKARTAKQVLANVEKQLRRAADAPPDESFESQLVPADDSRERKRTGDLARYFDEVIVNLQDAASILIFGPGEAKVELQKRLELNHREGRVLCVEVADRMTERQIVSRVRRHFHPPDPQPISYGGEILRRHRG